MDKKLILVAPCLAFLAACGGSSDGSATNPTTTNPTTTNPTTTDPTTTDPTTTDPITIDPTTTDPTTTDLVFLQTFGDGAGIARVKMTDAYEESFVVTLMRPNISSYSTDSITDVITELDTSDVLYVGSNLYGDFYGGTATRNGTQVDLVYYVDSARSVAGGGFGGNGESVAMVLGLEVSNIPSGSYSYTGTNIIGLRDGSYAEDGTFEMSVDFTSGTASLTGLTASSSIGGSGISVNSSDGTFTSNNLTLTETALSTTATIHGNFHGSGATGVTGIYTDNATTPTYTGVIVGTR